MIEKDLAAAKLASVIDADMLLIFTGVQKVYLDYGTSQEKQLDSLNVTQARQYLDAGQFEAGSMAPKIEAAIEFVGSSAIRKAVITKLDSENPDRITAYGTVIHS